MRGLISLARSLEGRTVAVLLLAVLLVHGGALMLYRRSATAAADAAFATEVARQLVLAREAVLRRPPDERGTEAKALSSDHFEIGWDPQAPPGKTRGLDPALRGLHDRLVDLEPALGPGLALTLEVRDDPLHPPDLRGVVPLPDGSVLTFRSAHAPGLARLAPWAYLATAMAVLVGASAVFLVHWIAGPLRDLTRATQRIGHGTVVPVPEAGPDETRRIGQALNAMQERIHRLVTERTQALAAVSHDLRTPIARLRLRLDSLGETEERRAMAADLDDMQAMVDATLAYLRGDANPEARRITNVASILISVADASADAGRDVAYQGPGRALATVRPMALRRALENLVDNGVRYGSRVRMHLEVDVEETVLVARVDDDGPGISPEDVPRAFEPFTRLEGSRNRNTGGTGLGLTIAKRAIEAEGGTLSLANRPKGGLRAEIRVRRTKRRA